MAHGDHQQIVYFNSNQFHTYWLSTYYVPGTVFGAEMQQCAVSCGALFIWSLLNLPEQCLAHSRRYICWGVKWISRQCKLLLDPGWLCSLQHKGKRNCRKWTERRGLLSWWVVMGALSLLFSSFSKISALGCPHFVISEKTTSSFQVSLLSFKM